MKIMKTGRNDPCPCGSAKKYKNCCMDAISKQNSALLDDISQVTAMNPNLTHDELDLVLQQKAFAQNNRPIADFCGLSPAQMANWLYAPFNELNCVAISPPDDLSSSPVMRYLEVILDEAMAQNGSFKATSKGNLPTKLVKQASGLLPEFAVAQFSTNISISEYAGSNEDKFNALHYTRILAELSGIIYRKSGSYHVKKAAQKQYQSQGLTAFFLPMLEAAITKYNWGYLDSWEHDAVLSTFWLFMLWRLQSHASVDELIDEVATAFPDLLHQFPADKYRTPQAQLGMGIDSRFLKRFLQFWGFITLDPKRLFAEPREPRKVQIQPLLTQTFKFTI
jgi:hypothetical protein|nr:SEC-C metal-binding domain-containing protein [Shewanella denitrificans]